MNPESTHIASDSSAILRRLFPPMTEESRLTIACPRRDYQASAIARAVEDCDAHLLNLNVTSGALSPQDDFSDDVIVDLRVSHRHATAVARSLERYGMRVIAASSVDDTDTTTARERINELLHQLDL